VTTLVHPADEILSAFAAALRAGGVPVTPDRTQAFLRAVAEVGAVERSHVYWAGQATLCSSPDDLERYDAIFSAWFSGEPVRPGHRPTPARRIFQADLDENVAADGEPGTDDVVQALASDVETLRHRDIAELSLSEQAAVSAVFRRLKPVVPTRRSLRYRPSRRGDIDGVRTLREQLRHGGEPARLRRHDRSWRARRVVVLVDVSGSMAPYADSQIRWAHLLARANLGRTEVFTIGTRLTRVTKAMASRDAEAALRSAGEAVPDWSGGTRLGEAIGAFLDRWGQRGLARRAVVVVMSDGWERGDSAELAGQMARLHRLAHRVVWINPHQGKVGYEPVQSGIVAALPFVDDFIAGHSIATFERALEVIGRA
jgi:uncharacterized protein